MKNCLKDTNILRLSDGRTFCYAEYGDPDGKPVILLERIITQSAIFKHPAYLILLLTNIKKVVNFHARDLNVSLSDKKGSIIALFENAISS